jgi:hypothetical protein
MRRRVTAEQCRSDALPSACTAYWAAVGKLRDDAAVAATGAADLDAAGSSRRRPCHAHVVLLSSTPALLGEAGLAIGRRPHFGVVISPRCQLLAVAATASWPRALHGSIGGPHAGADEMALPRAARNAGSSARDAETTRLSSCRRKVPSSASCVAAASTSRRYGPRPSPSEKTAAAGSDTRSATRAARSPRRARAAARSCALGESGVITRPGALNNSRPVEHHLGDPPSVSPRGAVLRRSGDNKVSLGATRRARPRWDACTWSVRRSGYRTRLRTARAEASAVVSEHQSQGSRRRPS